MPQTTTKKRTAREMGVPDEYLTEKGTFRRGLDARYKSDLIAAALGKENPNALTEITPRKAKAQIRQRGWDHFLEKAEAKAKAGKPATQAAMEVVAEGGGSNGSDPASAESE